jgi:hypothetical protein
MTLSLGDKAQRALRLLLGLRNPRVSSALAPYGFSEADINEGWTLLQALGRGKLSISAIPSTNVEAIQQLDQWENRWFPIAMASLARRYPAVHARLFLNLSQTDGPEVAVSVGTFLERYDELADPNGRYGAEGPKAKELLQTRGLTAEVLDEARLLLEALARVAPSKTPPSADELKTDLARAEEQLWAWYLEWSQVARTAIRQRVLLRQLGFLGDRGSPEEEPEPEPVPAPTNGQASAR